MNHRSTTLLATVLLLAGCGGGNDSGNTAAPSTPAATSAPAETPAATTPTAMPDPTGDATPTTLSDVAPGATSTGRADPEPAASDEAIARAEEILEEVVRLYADAEASLRSVTDTESAEVVADELREIFGRMSDLKNEFNQLLTRSADRRNVTQQSDYDRAAFSFATGMMPLAQTQQDAFAIIKSAVAEMPTFGK